MTTRATAAAACSMMDVGLRGFSIAGQSRIASRRGDVPELLRCTCCCAQLDKTVWRAAWGSSDGRRVERLPTAVSGAAALRSNVASLSCPPRRTFCRGPLVSPMHHTSQRTAGKP